MKKSCLVLFFLAVCVFAFGADISEKRQIIRTYPFSGADPVPILVRKSMWGLSAKIYPYNFFDQFSVDAIDREWTVVTLENPYIEVTVMPEIGGKVWGAIEKSTGREFIYANDAVKFREVALRGPWTSGGIEFNFGLVGHTPATSTPVDYITRKNSDGSVSCIVGTMDLVSRSRWSIEIRLPKDKAYFETRAFYYNPSAIDQSYYCWTNSGVKVGEDMQVIYPGTGHIAHSFLVPLEDWPVRQDGRDLSWYKNNRFGSHMSYFTVGEYEDFFGCYWHDEAFGTGHWAKYEDSPGHKLWLWALSRQGGIWENLLTDNKGQYAELQAGRFLNQNDHGFLSPGSGDMWREVWFPYKDIGPMVKACDEAVLNVAQTPAGFKVAACAIGRIDEELVVVVDGREKFRKRIKLKPMQTYQTIVKGPLKGVITVDLGDLLTYTTDKKANDLEKPIRFHEVFEGTSEGLYMAGLRQEKWRGYTEALDRYIKCLKEQPRHVRAMSRIAGLYLRMGKLDEALAMAGEAIKEDMYDAQANYIYGVISRRMGKLVGAKESFGWAARSMEYRSQAYCQRAEIGIIERNWADAMEYAQMSLDYNRYNINALQAMSIALRKSDEDRDAKNTLEEILEIEPLNHYARYEAYLLNSGNRKLKEFTSLMRSEYANETYVEMGVYYAGLGLIDEAVEVFTLAGDWPTAVYWKAYLLKSKALLNTANSLNAELVFPYREESIPVFDWAVKTDPKSWKAKYYLGLIYWSKGRIDEARKLINGLDAGDFVPLYIARAYLNLDVDKELAGNDFQTATRKGPGNKRTWHHLVKYYIDQKQFDSAVKVARTALQKVPGEQVLELDLVRALVGSGQFTEALSILDRTTILPFEGASEIHELYVKSHKGIGIVKMAGGWYAEAVKHFEASKDYPERLGTGKPYEPDYRMQDYMMSLCYDVTGKDQLAARTRNAVADFTEKHPEDKSDGAYYGKAVLIRKGLIEKAKTIKVDQPPAKEVLEVIEMIATAGVKVSYGVDSWDQETYGNHRAIIDITKKAEAVLVRVPWRRRDKGVAQKGVVLLAQGSEKPIRNIIPVSVDRQAGEFLFAPVDGVSRYYLYYMPYISTGGYYPQVRYIKAEYKPDTDWASREKVVTTGRVTQFQSVDELNSFYPMEVIATEEETAELVKDAEFVLFPEDRKYPIRMVDDLPKRWIDRGPSDVFEGKAMRGEFYAFQIGVYANKLEISDLDISFSDLAQSGGGAIKSSAIRCFNTGGTSWDGTKFDKICSVGKGKVRALWCGIQIPVNAKPGRYQGVVSVAPVGGKAAQVKLVIDIDDQILADAGDSEPWRHSRLRWLDSTIALDDEVIKPYTPLEV
ncbi:MAG: DUF5107 domain-containing protein, partial [Anaerohalosphaera sp.]|nr:DUF5107 domain-containing protein [Anaerohalosphaera sp.]